MSTCRVLNINTLHEPRLSYTAQSVSFFFHYLYDQTYVDFFYRLATLSYIRFLVDRDCARWKLTPAEVQKRRALFWELFNMDCWHSLATDRLSTFSLPFVVCELPFDPDQIMSDDGKVQPSC